MSNKTLKMDVIDDIWEESVKTYKECIENSEGKFNIKDSVFQEDLLKEIFQQRLMAAEICEQVADRDIELNRKMSESLEDSRLTKEDKKHKEVFRDALFDLEKGLVNEILKLKSLEGIDEDLANKIEMIFKKLNIGKLARYVGVVLDDARYDIENDIELKRRVDELESMSASEKEQQLIPHAEAFDDLPLMVEAMERNHDQSTPYDDYPLIDIESLSREDKQDNEPIRI